MPAENDTRNLSLVDIPRVLRLTENVTVLDSRIGCTSAPDTSGAILASMMPHTSRHTLVARAHGQHAIGQFYMTPDGDHAQLAYLAPRLEVETDDSAWLLILDAMVRQAGKRGAHTLRAELDENSPLFETMRQSGFAVYARQFMYMHQPHQELIGSDELDLQPTDDSDATQILLIYSRTVPSLLQQVGILPDNHGYLYRENGQVMGYINVAEGREGVYLMPYMDHRVGSEQVAKVIITVASLIPRASKRPLTVRVRRHQGWFGSALEDMGFERVAQQAVMVRHIAAGIHSPAFTPLKARMANGKVQHKTERVPEICIETLPPPKIRTTKHLVCWTKFSNRVACDGMSHTQPERYALRPDGGLPRIVDH